MIKIQAGEEVEVTLPFRVLAPYHIQADTVNDENLIPTTLQLDEAGGIQLKAVDYPEYKRFKLKGTSDHLLVFDGVMEVVILLDATQAQPGQHQLKGGLRYQACDDSRCLFPRQLEFLVNAEVIP